MRKKIIAGNWKMNKGSFEAREFAGAMATKVDGGKADVVFCVPFVSIHSALVATKDASVAIGAQNMHYENQGAYTGEISPAMLKDLGVQYVIIGHSERRAYFAETDEMVNKKAKAALAHGLIPILCVGESLGQRQLGITIEHVCMQVKIGFNGIPAADAEKIVIAYEPIWAIGTGVTATASQAEEACAAVRGVISELYGRPTADKIRIQYGGSVTADNARELFEQPNIDGGLVGGASIKADFDRIVNYQG
jgi:triosephosphate isomerase